MQLRTYQSELVKNARVALRKNKAVAVQLPTGGGKSHIFAAITSMAYEKKNRIWICVPKSELIWQTSEHLYNRNIPHGIIKASHRESLAYNVHIISMSTIKRRIAQGKIKRWPTMLIFDESHVEIIGQKYIVDRAPPEMKVLGFSATQERYGKDFLKRCKTIDFFNSNIWKDKPKYNGLYDVMVKGPTIGELIEMGYLTHPRYFSPPIEGLDEIKRKGEDYDEKELEAFFKRKAVYGKAISHYKELADGKPCLVYCRSVKAAEHIADQFQAAGYNFVSIDGSMTDKQRKDRINGLKDGTIQGLTSCDLIAIGLDVPNVECVIMLRPTLSRPLFFQMIGRGIRTAPGKDYCIILDHVNNIDEHIEIQEGQTLYDALDVEWQFCGNETKKKKKGKNAIRIKFCEKCYQYFEGATCPCGNKKVPIPVNIKVIDGRLVEKKGPVPFNELPFEEKRAFHEMVAAAKKAYMDGIGNAEIDYGPIRIMCRIAKERGYSVMWVYNQLNELEMAVNIPLLKALQKVMKYKNGWAYFKQKELQKRFKPQTEEAPF